MLDSVMKGLGNMLYSNTRTLNTFGFLVSLLIWVFAAGCAVECDTFDKTGEYMGTVLETSEGAIRTRDNAAVDREGEYWLDFMRMRSNLAPRRMDDQL